MQRVHEAVNGRNYFRAPAACPLVDLGCQQTVERRADNRDAQSRAKAAHELDYSHGSRPTAISKN